VSRYKNVLGFRRLQVRLQLGYASLKAKVMEMDKYALRAAIIDPTMIYLGLSYHDSCTIKDISTLKS
jgi:hypothetical protein